MEVQFTPTTLGVFIVVFVLFLLAVLFYLYPGAGKQSTIPGPPPSDVKEGNASDLQRAGSLQAYLRELHAEYGDVTAFWHGSNQIVSIADYDEFAPVSQVFEIPDVLFASWSPLIGQNSFVFEKGVRNFQRRDMLNFDIDASGKAKLAKIFLQFSTELSSKWSSIPTGQHIPLTQHISGLATRSVCRMLFGDYFKDDKKVIALHKSWVVCWTHVEGLTIDQENLDEDVFNKNLTKLKSIISEALEYRFDQSEKGDSGRVIIDGLLGKSRSSNALTEEELLCDAITMLTIGMHVTTNILLWVIYFVSSHRDVQTKLRKTLNKNQDVDIMTESIANINYLQNVIRESIRCGQIFSWRGKQQDIETRIKEHTVPKQTPVIEAVGEACNCDKQWSDPCRFDPDRFSTKENKIDPMDFIPFAFGSKRNKPSQSVVYLFVSIATAVLIRNLDITLEAEEKDSEPAYTGFISKPSAEELWVTVSPAQKKKIGDIVASQS